MEDVRHSPRRNHVSTARFSSIVLAVISALLMTTGCGFFASDDDVPYSCSKSGRRDARELVDALSQLGDDVQLDNSGGCDSGMPRFVSVMSSRRERSVLARDIRDMFKCSEPRYLKPSGSEFFKCTVESVRAEALLEPGSPDILFKLVA